MDRLAPDFEITDYVQLLSLLDLKYPHYMPIAWTIYTPDVVDCVLESPQGIVVQTRWVYGQSGRWSLIPLDSL